MMCQMKSVQPKIRNGSYTDSEKTHIIKIFLRNSYNLSDVKTLNLAIYLATVVR